MSSKAGFACLCMVMSSLIISLQVWVKFVLFRSEYHASISTKSIGFMSLVHRSEKERCKTHFILESIIKNKTFLPIGFCIKVIMNILSQGFQRVSKLCTNAFSNSASAVNFLNRNLKFCLKDISPKYTWAEELHYLQQVFAKIQLWNNFFWWICLDKLKRLTSPIYEILV